MSMAKSKEEEDEVARTDGLEIISIGCLYKGPWDKKYWSCSRGKDRYPYPIGYQAVRAHGGNRCKIEVHEGSKGPLFMVTTADGHSCSGQTPNIAWDRFQKKGFPRMKIWHGKRFSCKIGGTEFFGFKDPLVQRLLRELVANVDGIAEPNLVASSFCSGPSLTEQVLRCPNSCSYPDLRACLVEPRTTRKRSRRLENTSTRSSSEVCSKRLQTTVLENAKDSNPGGSQWKHNSVSSCIYSASSGDKIICGSSGILSKQMNSNIVTEYDGVQAADEKNLESSEDHKSTGLTRYVSTAEESFDRSKHGTAPGLSYSVGVEHNIEEPPFVKDPAVNVRDIPLCVLDTYDSLEVDYIDRSHDLGAILGKTSLNSQGAVAANQKSDFEGLIVESHPGGEMDKDPLNCSSENSDLNSVSRDVAKSMMTVLLPQALPLLNEASRKKSEAKQCVSDAGHLLGAVEFEEKNPGSFVNVLSTDLANYENARVEKEENMPVLTTDSASIIRSTKNSNAIAPDSFEDKPNFTNISGTQSIFHLDQRHAFSSEKIQGERAHSRNIFHHGSLDLPHEWANMSTDSFSFDESLVAASDCISDGYDHGRTNHEADAKAGLGNNDCAMIECNSLLTGKSECPSEGNLCRISRNDCSAERCTSAGDFLCQEINDEPGRSDIAKGFTIRQSNGLPTAIPTTNVKDDTNEGPTGSQVQASVRALVKKNISSFPSSQPSIDEKPGISLPSLMSATVTLGSMKDTAKKDETAPQLKSSGNMHLNNEQESIYKLVGCYIHPFPIVAVWLSTHENEIYICILSGLEKDKVKTLFLYKVPTEHAGAGCPSFLGHTQVTFPIPQKIYGGQIVPERSYVQFTPHGKGLVFLGCVEAPCCRERRISCSCSTCASVSFDENAIRIVQANMGYVTLVANLKAIERLHSILVCEPDYLVAIGGSGRMHLWAMNPAWSAETEEFDIPTNDCVSPCIVELKKIPRHAYLVVGHNGLGEFSLWDVSKRIFLSKFSHTYPSICSFLPISLSRWRRQDFISGNRNLEEHVDEIMEATAKSFSGHDVNHAFLHLEEEDIALWLLVAAVSEVEHDYQSNARRTDSVIGWRLALLAEKMVVLGNTLDPRAASVGVLSGQGIIATNEGYVYMWELSTGKRLGTLHRFPGGSVSCIATNDSTPAVFAAAGDGGKLLVYRHSQF